MCKDLHSARSLFLLNTYNISNGTLFYVFFLKYRMYHGRPFSKVELYGQWYMLISVVAGVTIPVCHGFPHFLGTLWAFDTLPVSTFCCLSLHPSYQGVTGDFALIINGTLFYGESNSSIHMLCSEELDLNLTEAAWVRLIVIFFVVLASTVSSCFEDWKLIVFNLCLTLKERMPNKPSILVVVLNKWHYMVQNPLHWK